MQVAARHISKSFGVSAALHDVSLDVASGELVALLGPSGSGKTTLLRIVAGLERPDQGQILFGQEDTSGWPVQRRRVGFVFQHYALFKHMTVAENIAFGLSVLPRSRRPARGVIADKVASLLKLVQLDGYGGRYPAQLSGGQRQRIALARALAIDPSVLLLDEPFGALDAKVRKDLRRWLRQIHDETGLTTLFVTHDQEEALELADRIVVLNHGRIEQVGAPDDIFDRPASAFVHGFIGEASRLEARVVGDIVYVAGQSIGPIAAPQANGLIELFVRPQDLRITAPGERTLKATVRGGRRAGGRFRLETVIGPAQAPLEVELEQSPQLAPGADVFLAIERYRAFPLDASQP